jgi:hypothetical protein
MSLALEQATVLERGGHISMSRNTDTESYRHLLPLASVG